MRTITILIMVLACVRLASGEVPGVTTYQGVLTDDSGLPLEGVHDLRFAIYGGETAVDPLWIEEHTAVPLDRGVFSVLLGSVMPFPSDMWQNPERWIGVSVDGGEEVSPRFFLASVPWAMKAAVADVALSGGGGAGDGHSLDAVDGDPVDVVFVDEEGTVTVGDDRFDQTHVLGRLLMRRNDTQQLEVFSRDSYGHFVYGRTAESDKKSLALGSLYDETGSPSGEAYIRFILGPAGDYDTPMVIKENGSVGIGTTSPPRQLSVENPATAYARLTSGGGNGSTLELKSTYPGPGTWYGRIKFLSPSDAVGAEINYLGIPLMEEPGLSFRTNGYTRMFINGDTGDVGIGVSDPQHKLHVNGDARVDVLHISGADVAEKFPVSESITAGSVVAIDAERPGQMCLSREAYDRKVAGVVSGAGDLPAGAVLGNLPDQGETAAVALSGRVWVKCDAREQPIAPGDLLTSADVPGHAMKVTDHARATGAVIGKAMTGLASGRGLVLVLVSLQ